jgi:tetratricopeptide (TPR) repeat protein
MQMPHEATSPPARGRSLHEAPTLPPGEPAPPPAPKRNKLTETLRDPSFTMPPPRAPEDRPAPYRAAQPPPAPAPKKREVPSELVEIQAREDMRVLKQEQGGGAGKWIGLLLVLLGIGGAAGWYLVVYAPEQQRLKELADIQARAKADEESRAREDETRKAAEAQKKKEDEAAAAAKAAAAAAATAVVDAGAPEAAVGVADKKDEKKDEKKDDKKEKKGCTSVDCWISQGDRLRDRERAEAALDAYGRALDLKEDNVEALTGKGLCFLDMAKPALAEPVLEQALKVNPRYAPAIMGLAESYRFQGKKEAAIGMYQKYLENFPSGPEASVAKANIDRLR